MNAPAEQLTSSIKNKNKRAKTEMKNVCACVRLTLSGVFRSFDQRKFTPLNNVFLAGDFLAIITFDNLHERMETWLEHNTVNISVNTSCVESCKKKTNFSEVVHPLNFSENNFPLLKARPNSYLFTADLVFSL